MKKTKLCTMKVADFVKINAEMMKLLSRLDIKTSDFKYNDIFAEYEKMSDRGYKVTYIVALLSEKYSISEASIYRMLKRFRRTI